MVNHNNPEDISKQILSDITVHMKYAKYIPELQRRETWDEIVTRNKEMHLRKFPQLTDEIEEAYQLVYERKSLPSMRSLQFAGKPIELNNARLYNCCFIPIDHPDAFSEMMFLLLSGVGVGYSVQRHHVKQLPEIRKPTKRRRYLVGDSIEGWSDAVKVLFAAFYSGKARPDYDFRDVRPKGAALITSGGKAPGPEPLKDALHHIEKILDRKENGERLTTLEVHDICCYIADAVLAGGIRRSATIALFDVNDEEMLTCKFGDWYILNPQRARANNSAVVVRHKVDKATFDALWDKVQASGSGEPGIFFTHDKSWGLNPCAEISLRSNQFCNLGTVNVSDLGPDDQEEFNRRVKATAFICTLQASYTDFHYLRDIWKETTEKEALIGVSMAGIASGGVMQLDMDEAGNVVTAENARVAKLIGIKPAARCTTVKPEGTSSLVISASSGIHAWHNDYYIRRIRVGKDEPIYQYLAIYHPELLEDEYFRPTTQAVISVPVKAPEGAITRHESALDLLDRVARVQNTWIRAGHRRGSNMNNVSTTVTIKPDEWDAVGKWMWDHKDEFTALSVLPHDGGSYIQAPHEDVTKEQYEELYAKLTDIDLTQVVEIHDNTALADQAACAGGACEIT